MTGVYVHVPFCTRRCPYCAFVLIESDGSLHQDFVERLCREIRESPHRASSISTLYFGGGTPSLLTPAEISRIYDEVSTVFGKPGGEVTLEVNPEDISGDRLRGYAEAGVNRLSLGVQALEDSELREFGRGHTVARVEAAWKISRGIFSNVSVDLMFGLEGQAWTSSLRRIVEWDPPHVSLYGLTYEPGTVFTRDVDEGKRNPIPSEREGVMYQEAVETLTKAGFRHYEISNFARPGMESRHNQAYWEGKPYLGFGPGAHSYIPYRRWANLSNVRRYLESENPVMSEEDLTVDQRILEQIYLGLRRDTGVDLPAFRVKFGVDLQERNRDLIAELESLGLVRMDDDSLCLTGKGKLLADEVIGKFA